MAEPCLQRHADPSTRFIGTLLLRETIYPLHVVMFSCMVIEDSLIGLEAALGARMNCVITYTGSTKSQVRESNITTCSCAAAG